MLIQFSINLLIPFLINQQHRSNLECVVTFSFLKEFCGNEVYDISDSDVLDFLVFKDVNNSGRTIIHHRACPFLGSDSLHQCKDPVKCASNIQQIQ